MANEPVRKRARAKSTQQSEAAQHEPTGRNSVQQSGSDSVAKHCRSNTVDGTATSRATGSTAASGTGVAGVIETWASRKRPHEEVEGPGTANTGTKLVLDDADTKAAKTSVTASLAPVESNGNSCETANATLSADAGALARERKKGTTTDVAEHRGLAFLRLSSECRPSMAVSQLVYLNKDEVTFGRLPTCNVVLDSARAPQMVSRTHGIVRWLHPEGGPEEWVINDNRSLNGILVNDTPVGGQGRNLQPGDVITFGRKMQPPEFEFVFEAPPMESQAKLAAPQVQQPPEPKMQAVQQKEEEEKEELFGDQMRKIAELQKELAVEREQKAAEAQRRRQASNNNLNIVDLHSELACSICQDWLVHAATIECSHTFCWSCIDTWLLQKKFECPVCRHKVTREPVRTRAVDTIVRKSVDRLTLEQKDEFSERVATAEATFEKARRLHLELEKSVGDALKRGKAFFHIGASWNRRERETFQRGVKDYTGDTRETYCKLTGLTVQWVHSADESKLNQALHNLQLQAFVSCSEEEIRQRLLMFLRYG